MTSVSVRRSIGVGAAIVVFGGIGRGFIFVGGWRASGIYPWWCVRNGGVLYVDICRTLSELFLICGQMHKYVDSMLDMQHVQARHVNIQCGHDVQHLSNM